MKRFEGKRRCEVLGEYIKRTGDTVRGAAMRYGIGKSTVHKDVTADLSRVNPTLASEVREILERNKMERHLRGGEATRRKYLSAKK